MADAFGAEGKTTTPALPGGSAGKSLTVEAKPVTAAAADGLIAAALGAGKSGKSSSAVSKIDSLFKALNAAAAASASGGNTSSSEIGADITVEKKEELTKAGINALDQALNSMTANTEGVSQVATALASVVGGDTGVLSEESTAEAAGLVGKNLELMMALPDPPTPDAAVNTLSVIGALCIGTARTTTTTGETGSGERRLSEAGSGTGSGEGGSGSGEAPRSKEALQFETLRAGITALGDATLKGGLDGEVPVAVVSRNVQSSASKASGASLAGQTFGAAKGPTGLSLPAGLSAAGSVAVKIAVIDKSINTYGADSAVEPESDMVSIKMTDDTGGNVAKKGAIGDADPLVILIDVKESAAPLPCGTAGAISCVDLDSFGRCDVNDPKSRNETCNGRGDCVNDQCACDLPYLGFNCSESIGCNYWDDDTRAWSSEGCTSKGVTEVNGCSSSVLYNKSLYGLERRLSEAVEEPDACAYALRCECTHLTDFGGMAAWSKCPLGSAPARLLCLLRARLAAVTGSALSREGSTHWAPSHCLGCSS